MFLIVSSSFFLHATSAQNDERLKEKAETLLNVVKEVNASIISIFNKITMGDLDIPLKAEERYLEGSLLANRSFALFRNGSYFQATSKAVESLKLLREVLVIADQVLPYVPEPFEEAALKILELNASIVQVYDYLSRLENSFNKTVVQDYNSSAFLISIEDAKEHLDFAQAKLGLLKIKDTEEQLASAKASLSEAVKHMNALTVVVKALKTKQFIVVAERRLTLLRANITSASLNVSQQVRNASLTALNTAESRLQTAKNLMANDMVDESVEELEESKKYERLAVKHLESAGVILDVNDVENIDTSNEKQALD
jgi:tetratricopeptide (TPR) repeat protein